MGLGRFIYGLGGESLIITIVAIVSNWFYGEELSFA